MNKIEEYVVDVEKKNTKRSIKQHLNSYFSFMDVDPGLYVDKRPKIDYENKIEKEILTKHKEYVKINKLTKYDLDFLVFYEYLKDKSPLTRKQRLNTVKLFLEDNNITISKKALNKTIKKVNAKPITLDSIPTNSELKQILQHGGILERALFLFTASSGMRINCEALQIEAEDIDFNHNPVLIRVRAEIAKNGQPRVCFISNEAKEMVLEWLKVRGEYLVKACNKKYISNLAIKKNPNDDRLFPISYTAVVRRWHRMLYNSGYDKKDRSTNIHIFHIHTLRKLYETRMSTAGIPEAIYQQLEGHEGYLNGSYKRYTEQELSEFYLKAIPSLSILESTPDLSGINEQMQEKDQIIGEMQKRIDSLEDKYGDLLHEIVMKKKD